MVWGQGAAAKGERGAAAGGLGLDLRLGLVNEKVKLPKMSKALMDMAKGEEGRGLRLLRGVFCGVARGQAAGPRVCGALGLCMGMRRGLIVWLRGMGLRGSKG